MPDVDYLAVILRETVDLIQECNLPKVMARPKDLIAQDLISKWAALQTTLAGVIRKKHGAGILTNQQYDFIIDWLANLDRIDPKESKTFLEAWLSTREGGWTE